jgi:hypothetical protein
MNDWRTSKTSPTPLLAGPGSVLANRRQLLSMWIIGNQIKSNSTALEMGI